MDEQQYLELLKDYFPDDELELVRSGVVDEVVYVLLQFSSLDALRALAFVLLSGDENKYHGLLTDGNLVHHLAGAPCDCDVEDDDLQFYEQVLAWLETTKGDG